MFEFDNSNLNGWRGLLALIVFFCHAYQIFFLPVYGNEGSAAFVFSISSSLAVVFFIVLSGYVISLSELKNENFNWKLFVQKRISRIYPAYLFSILLCCLLVSIFYLLNNGLYNINVVANDRFLVRDSLFFNFTDIVGSVGMLFNSLLKVNGPLWSLLLEWWLYVSAIFVFVALGSMRNKSSFFSYWLIFLIIPFGYLYYVFSYQAFFYVAIWYSGFAYLRVKPVLRKGLVISTSAAMIIYLLVKGDSFVGIYRAYGVGYWAWSLCTSVVFLFLAFRIKLPIWFSKLSVYSYTLYIIHFPLLLFTFGLLHHKIGNNVWSILAVLLPVMACILLLAKVAGTRLEDKRYFLDMLKKWQHKLDKLRSA